MKQDFHVLSKRQLRERETQVLMSDPKRSKISGNGPSGKVTLTSQQLEIVECREKCVILYGAPGSGKTLILMLRALNAAMENKAGSVFVFVNEKLKAKYEHYFFEEKDKIFVDDVHNIDRRPNVHTIDKINFAEPEDDVFFDETPVEDSYIEIIKSRMNCSGTTTVVFTGLHKPREAVASLRLYRPRLLNFKHIELMKVLRGTGNIFEEWEHYYSHGFTIGHSIYGVAVKNKTFDCFEQVQNEIANKIANLTSAKMIFSELPSLKEEHIAVITCDYSDSTDMKNYFDMRNIPCGEVDEQARRLKSTSIVAVDVYLSTPSYEWPIVFIVLKPGVTKKEVLPIAASRCIASLNIVTYKKAAASSIKADEPHPMEEEIIKESNIQSSLRRIYSKSYRNFIPFSLPFFFDIESKWVNLTLKLEGDSEVTEDYVDLLKKAFAKADMLIIEGDPGVGKSSLMHRLAYEWTQSRITDYDLVLYTEFRKLREYECKDIKELIIHYMKGYLDEEDYEIFYNFISDAKCYKEHKILVLLDGYDESSLEKQCQELSDFFSNTISRPLQFNVLITSRKGYLSTLRNQGRFIFADIIGFTTESQRQEYISKHFNAENDTGSLENTSAVTHLLNTNANLERLSESPLMLTFICLLHKKVIDGTEVELYMNTLWWMIDRHQKSNPNLDVPSLFEFEHDACDKFRFIENNYQHFPQLHLLGTMAMQDIFKTTFTESDLKTFQIQEVVQQVGFLRKEVTRDRSYHMKTEYSFLHRTIQEFIMALTFFFSKDDTTLTFIYYVFLTATNKGYGIIPAKLQMFLNMIYFSKIKIDESKKNIYSELIKFSKKLYSAKFSLQEHSRIIAIHSINDVVDMVSDKQLSIPRSSEEAIQLLHDEANKGDAFTQYILGVLYNYGISTKQSNKEAVIWYRKSAEQGHASAQNQLGLMYFNGQRVPQSDVEAVKWYTKAAEQGDAVAQNNLGWMYQNGKGVPQSDEEAVKWYREAAETGYADALNNLGVMYESGRGVPHSDEEAVKWYTKAAEQGDAVAQNNLGRMYQTGRGKPQSYDEAIKWYRKSAEQGNAVAQFSLGVMYEYGRGVSQSDEEALKWYKKSAEKGDAVAQNNLGWMYQSGKGVPQSHEKAVKWYRKAAAQEESYAQDNLGFMYLNGRGVPQSVEEAVKWYREAAEQGHVDAQFNLGFMYLNGLNVLQSDEEAEKWYRKAAGQGCANAQFNLEFIFDNGRGVPRLDGEVVKWFIKSAEQGYAIAQNNLGWMYYIGLGVPQSDTDAVKWYRKAAEQGNASAQYNLGQMYQYGRGVPQSHDEAKKWYRKAAEQGNADAKSHLGVI